MVTSLHTKPITADEEFSFSRLEGVWLEIQKIAEEELGISNALGNLRTNQFEVVTAEQMCDAYASVGMPVGYNHWSKGKEFLKVFDAYQRGNQHLAYEMVINTDPCINLLMEENPLWMMALVLAHAGVGHGFFFANNTYYREWSNPSGIIDYLVYAKAFIARCEDSYGVEEVERVLDAAHAIETHSTDKFPRKAFFDKSDEQIAAQMRSEDEARQRELDIILQTTTYTPEVAEQAAGTVEEENILYFIMTHAPNMPRWKREILKIVYNINAYFRPQHNSQKANEGMATFCHHYIMERLEEKGFISNGAYLAFLSSHSGVIYQPEFDSPHYSGFNPYSIGFAIYKDIKRICENPTEEDRRWMPHLIGRKWQDAIRDAATNYRDDSFIQQFLSPKVIRDFKMFAIKVDAKTAKTDWAGEVHNSAAVFAIHDERGYRAIRNAIAESCDLVNFIPPISVVRADLDGSRTLELKYKVFKDREIDEADAALVLGHIDYLWGYKVSLEF